MILYIILYIIFGILILIWILDLVFKNTKSVKCVLRLPTPKGLPVIGNALEMIVPPARDFDGVYGWWSGPVGVANVYNAEDIETIVSTSKHNPKSEIYKIFHPWLREGLLVSQGSKWMSRRKVLTPAFHFNILRQFWPILEDNGRFLVDTLAKRSEEVNVVQPISEYTLSSLCETAMGTSLHNEEFTSSSKNYKAAIYKIGELLIERFSKAYLLSDFIYNLTKLSKDTEKQMKILQAFTKNVICERKHYIDKYGIRVTEDSIENDDVYFGGKKKKIAMLDLMIEAEKNGIIDRNGVQEEVDTFMFEGHDTTATGISFLLMLLANHKTAQNKIYEELQEICGDTERGVTFEDLSSLKYLERCIKESLRLYPPVHFIGRKLTEAAKLGNCTIPKGTSVHIHIYDLHRNEKYFESPNDFDPDRFLPENVNKRHPYAYIPFSAGPRNCIGQRFAMVELKSCIAAILKKFELLPVTRPEDLILQGDLTLRNSKPIYVKFVLRK